jgi:sensor histidine kinase YesM
MKLDRYGESPRENFDDFFHAFISIYVILIGDDWQLVMYNSIRSEGYGISIVYFITLLVVGNFVLFNLFLAILLSNFEVGSVDQNVLLAKKTSIEATK